MSQLVKNLPAMWETWVQPLEKGKATHSSIMENSLDYTVHGVEESDTTERLSLTHLIDQNLLPLMLFLFSKTRKNKPTHSSMIFQNFEVFFLEGISFVVMSCLVPV